MSANSSTSSSKPVAATTFHRYLRGYLLLGLLLTALLAGFNWLIDPYGIFGAPQIEGVNRIKYGFNQHLRLAKIHAVSRLKPATVILGSSRADSGLDPTHAAFRRQPVFNLSINGASIYELYRLQQHAQAVQPLAELVIAVDFFMFNADLLPIGDFDESLLAVTVDGTPTRRLWPEAPKLLLSAMASSDSWWSWRHQDETDTHYSALGFRDETVDRAQVLNHGGHRLAFRANEEYFARFTYSPQGRGYALTDARGGTPFRWLRRLLDDCRARGTQVHLLINPVHVRQYQIISALGLWPRYQDWKRQVLAVSEAEAADHGAAPYPLWDFGVINATTTEAVPPLGDKTTAMMGYRESSHYLKALGDRMLDRVLADPMVTDTPPDGFGLRLTAANVDRQLALQARRLAQWQAGHGDEVAEIEQIAARHRR